MAGLRTKREPDDITTTRNIATRHYQASRPTGGPESTSPWRLPRCTLVSSCLSVIVLLRTGVTTSFPSDTETSTKVPSSTAASCAKGFGIRRAKLLPHFCTCNRKGVPPNVSTKKIRQVSFRSQDSRWPDSSTKPNDSRLSCPASHCCGAGEIFGTAHSHFQKERVSRVSFSRGSGVAGASTHIQGTYDFPVPYNCWTFQNFKPDSSFQ